jgi:hypothetical protein
MNTVRAFAWESNETSPRLTPDEVDELFKTCQVLAKAGVLNGKFKNACQVIPWQRLPQGE